MASWILPKNKRLGIFQYINFFGRIQDNIFFFEIFWPLGGCLKPEKFIKSLMDSFLKIWKSIFLNIFYRYGFQPTDLPWNCERCKRPLAFTTWTSTWPLKPLTPTVCGDKTTNYSMYRTWSLFCHHFMKLFQPLIPQWLMYLFAWTSLWTGCSTYTTGMWCT